MMPSEWQTNHKLFLHQVGFTCTPFDYDAAPFDPAKTTTSMYEKWPDFDEYEVGFPEQRALFDLIWALNDTPPPVTDSDDLLEDSEGITRAFCEAVCIPFIAEALSWEPGADTGDYCWWSCGSFHANLRASTGLKWQEWRYVDIGDAPERGLRAHRRMKPHYVLMSQHRITLT